MLLYAIYNQWKAACEQENHISEFTLGRQNYKKVLRFRFTETS